MHVLGVVPARSGSKGIRRKNVVQLGGIPLIAHTFRVAKESRRLTRLIVTTDDVEIIGIATEHGVEVPFIRPSHLAEDDTPDLPVFTHCLHWLWDNERYRPDFVVHLRPTAPLRKPRNIDEAIDLLRDSPDYDSVRSVCIVRDHPLKMWRITEDRLIPFVPLEVFGIPEPYNQPRQLLPEAYVQNCVVDVIRTDIILHAQSMTGKRVRPYVMDARFSVDIDTEVDLLLAESLLAMEAKKQ